MKRMNSRELARAFAEGIPFGEVYKCHNAYANDIFYRLHGNAIVEKMSPHHIQLDPCGWHTRTTQRHINNVLDAFGYDKHLARKFLYKQILRHNGRIKDCLQVQLWKKEKSSIDIAKENYRKDGWITKSICVLESKLSVMEILRQLCYQVWTNNARLGDCLYTDLWLAQEQAEIPPTLSWSSSRAENKHILLAYKENAYAL